MGRRDNLQKEKRNMKKTNSKKKQAILLIASGALLLGAGGLAACAILQNNPGARDDVGQGDQSMDVIRNEGIEVKFLSSKTNSDGTFSKTFTYAIAPQSAPQEVKLTLAWANSSKTESVADYVTATSDSSAKTITVTCKKAFSTVINLSIESTARVGVKSTVTLNYVQKWLGWQDAGEAKAKKEEVIGGGSSPTKVADYLAAMARQENARYTPNLSTVYTKAYPDGANAHYEVTYKGYAPYVGGTSASGGTMAAISDAMAEFHANTRGTVWVSDTASTMIAPLETIYRNLSYASQREVNAGGYMGLIRTYSVKATLGSQEKTYDVSWILKAEVRQFSTYVEDISSITVEAPNIDF